MFTVFLVGFYSIPYSMSLLIKCMHYVLEVVCPMGLMGSALGPYKLLLLKVANLQEVTAKVTASL